MKDWPDEVFAAYLAAMIDGEGCIEIVGSYAVRVRIANTIKHTLDAMSERLGYSRVIEYKRPKDKNYKRLFCLEVSNVIDIKKLFDLCGKYIHMKPDQMAVAMNIVDRVLADIKIRDKRNQDILEDVAAGVVQNEIARKFNVSPQLISYIKKGHKWSSVISGHRARALNKQFPQGQLQCFRINGSPSDEIAMAESI